MGGRALRASVRAALFIAFTWFLFVGVAANKETPRTRITIQSTASSEFLKSFRTERFAADRDSELNYVSKRRVPSGPDPIHNRGVGKSRESPAGRV